MKPSVANRNMPAARYWRPPVLAPAIVATSTIEPRLPSIGIAFISTPLAPSACSIRGGGCSSSRPAGISGSSRRPPRSVVGAVGAAADPGDTGVCVTASEVVVTRASCLPSRLCVDSVMRYPRRGLSCVHSHLDSSREATWSA